MSYNCPICNKAGLPDYTKSDVVCPQCNSDLKPFSLLHFISKPQTTKIGTYFIIAISLLSIALLGLFLKANSDKKDLITSSVILNDSISKLQSVKVVSSEENGPNPIVEKHEAVIKYVVQKGDYPYKIAQFFYNDGGKYKLIETENNLERPYILKVGQILTIKISQE